MTALLWLLSMIPPAALFLIAGIWVVRKKYGGVRHVLGIAAIVVGLALVAITLVALPGIATTTTTGETEEPVPTQISPPSSAGIRYGLGIGEISLNSSLAAGEGNVHVL